VREEWGECEGVWGEYEGVWEQSCVNVEGRRRCVVCASEEKVVSLVVEFKTGLGGVWVQSIYVKRVQGGEQMKESVGGRGMWGV